MPIRIPARLSLQACCRPSRILLGTVPPRTGTQTPTQTRLQLTLPPSRRNMSSNSTTGTTTGAGNNLGPAPSSASPAPATSTPPLPGSSPSASPAAAGAAAAGAAPGESSSGVAAPTTASSPSMASGPGETQPTVTSTTTTSSGNDHATPQALPALPEPGTGESNENSNGNKVVHVNGQPVALDSLGPMVVNRDGTLARIANWHEMSAIERENTLRILGKRNQLRLGNLRAGLPADSTKEGSSS